VKRVGCLQSCLSCRQLSFAKFSASALHQLLTELYRSTGFCIASYFAFGALFSKTTAKLAICSLSFVFAESSTD